MLRNHAPDFVAAHPVATGVVLVAAGVGAGAALDHFGHPVAAVATVASVGGMGATELVSTGLSWLASKMSDDGASTDDSGADDAGFQMPSLGPTTDVTPVISSGENALGQASDAIGDAIGQLLGWANSEANPTSQTTNDTAGGPTIPGLPEGYGDPVGGILGVLGTLGEHVVNPATGEPYAPAGTHDDPSAALAWLLASLGYTSDDVPASTAPDGSPTLATALGVPGTTVQTPYGPVTLNQYGLPGDMLPPADWPTTARVIRQPVGCARPGVRRVIRQPIRRVVAMPMR